MWSDQRAASAESPPTWISRVPPGPSSETSNERIETTPRPDAFVNASFATQWRCSSSVASPAPPTAARAAFVEAKLVGGCIEVAREQCPHTRARVGPPRAALLGQPQLLGRQQTPDSA